MARGLRIDYPGAWHHVMNRGARQAPIFKGEDHCVRFLDALGAVTEKALLEVHAYSLMPNHFHLLVRSPEGTLSRAMKYLQGHYTLEVNRVHGWDGPVFRGRFRSQLVTQDDYLRHVVAYIHLNPVEAHLVGSPDEPSWTSHRAHVGLETPPPWLAQWGIKQWFGSSRELAKFVKAVQIGRVPRHEELDVRTGWFRKDALGTVPAEAPAQRPRIDDQVARLVQITGASVDQLQRAERGRDANPARRFAALALVRAGFSQGEIATALGMTTAQVSMLVYRGRDRSLRERFPEWHDAWAEPEPKRREGEPRRRATGKG